VIWSGRRAKQAHGFAVKPAGAEVVLTAVVVGAVFGFIAILNAYQVPEGKLRRIFEARGEVLPEGYTVGHGLPISVLILIAVAVIMTVIARKTRFGRYVYARAATPTRPRCRASTRAGSRSRSSPSWASCAGSAPGGAGAPRQPRQRHRHPGRAQRHRGGRDREAPRSRAAQAPSGARSWGR
jgi:hypothetical protein